MKLSPETWPKETQRTAKLWHGHRLARSRVARRPEVASYQYGHKFPWKCPSNPFRVSAGGAGRAPSSGHPRARKAQSQRTQLLEAAASEGRLTRSEAALRSWRACRHVVWTARSALNTDEVVRSCGLPQLFLRHTNTPCSHPHSRALTPPQSRRRCRYGGGPEAGGMI